MGDRTGSGLVPKAGNWQLGFRAWSWPWRLPALGQVFLDWLGSRSLWWSWMLALLMFSLVARGWFNGVLFTLETAPFSFDGQRLQWQQLMLHASRDAKLVLASTAVVAVTAWIGVRIFARLGMGSVVRWRVRHVPLLLMLLMVGLAHASYYRIAIAMHAPLGVDLLREAWYSGFGLADFAAEITPVYFALILLPATLYGASQLLARSAHRTGLALRNSLVLLLVMGTLALPFPRHLYGAGEELTANPVVYLVEDLLATLASPENPFAAVAEPPSPGQMQSLEWVDPLFLAEPMPPAVASGPGPSLGTAVAGGTLSKDYNLVFLILESVGRRYMFDTNVDDADDPHPMPMPFLYRLAQQGLHFTNHYSPSNSSPRSVFSLMTGLNPAPVPYLFATRRDIRVPTLAHFLGRKRAFLVTPGRTAHYFPQPLFRNAGIEMQDFYTIPERFLQREGSDWLRDERDAMDAFIAQVTGEVGSFLGIYYSGVAHYDYGDPGPEYRVVPDRDSAIHRYYNNLHYLDRQVERLFTALDTSGKLENTVVVIAGDHGEAFSQHAGNVGHSRASYNENFETFALIHGPGRFPAQEISFPTVHADLLPTILDGLGIGYDTAALQGESAFRARQRRYVFLYGNEDTLSSIDRQGRKLQLLYGEGRCRVFDLKVDAQEQRPLDCGDMGEQKRATLSYQLYQPQVLGRYNRRLATAACDGDQGTGGRC